MKKTMTPKQLEANRRNAQRSTGPRTAAGKAVSRQNALKHGLLAKEVVVRNGWGNGESPGEFRRLRREFFAAFAPANRVEAELVDRMVMAQWRSQRARRVEAAQAMLGVMRREQNQRQGGRSKLALMLLMREAAPLNFLRWADNSTEGLGWTQGGLKVIRDRVAAGSVLSDTILEEARRRLLPAHPVLLKLQALFDSWQQVQSGPDAEPRRAEHRAAVLALLDQEVASLDRRIEASIRRDMQEEDQELVAGLLLPPEQLDPLLRYETTSDRQFYQAMHHLERLQRQRLGEAVPAPFAVEVTERRDQAA